MIGQNEALELLKKALDDEIPKLRKLHHGNQEFLLWHDRIKNILQAGLPDDVATFASYRSRHIKDMFSDNVYQKDYLDRLTDYETAIKSIIEKYETLGIEEKPNEIIEPPKAFIAHEGETKQLEKLKEFLDALGIKYFIAEAEASNGRSIEGQVNWTQAKADFAICLATKGRAINKKTGQHYMGLNVADELGRAREVYKNRVILLVQKGVVPHTNTREIVYETFTSHCMDRAFTKVAKELRNWGFITVGKIKE